MEDYTCKPVATFRFTVENVSTLKDTILSPPCYVRHLPWNIKVLPWQHPDTKIQYLGVFLHCSVGSEWTTWSCCATAELSLLSRRDKPFSRYVVHSFYSKDNDRGYADFIPWDDILDPTKGYMSDDKITLEVNMHVGEPSGTFADYNNNIIHCKNNLSIVELVDFEDVEFMYLDIAEECCYKKFNDADELIIKLQNCISLQNFINIVRVVSEVAKIYLYCVILWIQDLLIEERWKLSRSLYSSLFCSTEAINQMADSMNVQQWQKNILGHSFTLPRSYEGYGEGGTILDGCKAWLQTHEEAQVMMASILVVVAIWWFVRTILTLLITMVCPLLVVILAVICVPQLRHPLLGQNYPVFANLLKKVLIKLAENIKT